MAYIFNMLGGAYSDLYNGAIAYFAINVFLY